MATPYAQVFDDGDGYLVTSRSKAGLINKVKGLARKGEASDGALLYDGTGWRFGEVFVGGEDGKKVVYKRD